jgi:hypothetical protein
MCPDISGESGFIESRSVYEKLQGLGFTPEQIDVAIIRANRAKLVETFARSVPMLNQSMPQAIRATSVGVYHILRLCHLFTYIDAIVVDTPIFDEALRDSARETKNIDDRLNRANSFRLYLDEQWKKISGGRSVFNWPKSSTALRKNIELAQISAAKRKRRDVFR